MVKIHAIQKTTLIDYPGKLAAAVFLAGCNFRCIFCHNPAAVSGQENISQGEFFEFLDKRKGKLKGVVVSGGEPTIHRGIVKFISRIKSYGYAVKLDTNGSNPKVLRELIKRGLLDYIAMDMKAPLKRYKEITQSKGFNQRIRSSIKQVMKSGVDYEFRTTCHPSLTKNDFLAIAKEIKGAKKYFLQKYLDKVTLNPQKHLSVYSSIALKNLKKDLEPYFEEIGVR